jgi:hypothetical protein
MTCLCPKHPHGCYGHPNDCGCSERDNRAALTKIAAECHRAKWAFDLSEDYRPTAKVSRAMIGNAFKELHRIGDMALKLRDALAPADGGGK